MENRLDQTATGYFTLVEHPDIPSTICPTKNECEGYIFISMVQLCNISQQYGQGRSRACNAFGGDQGKIPVQMIRKAWRCIQPGHRTKKFVLISSVIKYFEEVGIDWNEKAGFANNGN